MALGIVLVVIGVPLVAYYVIESSNPFATAFFGQSLQSSAVFGVLLVAFGVILVGYSEAGGEPRNPLVPASPFPQERSSDSVSKLESRILVLLSERKKPEEISNMTGVAQRIIDEKVASLYDRGYLTDGRELTEEGYDEISWSRAKPTSITSEDLSIFKPSSPPSPPPETSAPPAELPPAEIAETPVSPGKVKGVSSLWVVPIIFGAFSVWSYFQVVPSNPTTSSVFEFYVGLTFLTMCTAAAGEAIRRRLRN